MASDTSAILAKARRANYSRRETLFREGEPIDRVILLVSGCVKVTQLTASGSEVILSVKMAGDAVGGIGVGAGSPSPSTAHVLEGVQALVWDTRTLEDMAERMPALRKNIFAMMTEYISDLERRFRELATEEVALRLARVLVRLVERIGQYCSGAVQIGLSREELAQMTGTTLFTVSRLLSDWDERGITLSRRGTVLVLDQQRLVELTHAASPRATANRRTQQNGATLHTLPQNDDRVSTASTYPGGAPAIAIAS